MGMSLRQYLVSNGWDVGFLDKWGNNARIGVITDPAHCMERDRPIFRYKTSCFEPFQWSRRIFTDRRLPIAVVIPEGTEIRFLQSLKYELLGGGPLWYRLALMLFQRFSREDLTNMPAFRGFVEEKYRFEQFPFDEWLTVIKLSDFEAVYKAADEQLWTVSHAALTNVTQIEIRPNSGRT